MNSKVQVTVELNSKYPELVHKFCHVKSSDTSETEHQFIIDNVCIVIWTVEYE